MSNSASMPARSIPRSGRGGLPRNLAVVACLSLAATLTHVARADPLMGTVTLTVQGNMQNSAVDPSLGLGDFSASSVDSKGVPGPVDLSTLPKNLALDGGFLGINNNYVQFNYNINITFDMKITFNGTSGTQPYVELNGSLVGGAGGTFLLERVEGWATATPTSAVLHDWTPDSGVPRSLIDQYLNPASYHITGVSYGSQDEVFIYSMTVDPTPTPVPEPSTLLLYVAAIGGLLARSWARAWHHAAGQ